MKILDRVLTETSMGLSPQWPGCGVARDAGTKDNIVKRNVFKVVQATDNSGTL